MQRFGQFPNCTYKLIDMNKQCNPVIQDDLLKLSLVAVRFIFVGSKLIL